MVESYPILFQPQLLGTCVSFLYYFLVSDVSCNETTQGTIHKRRRQFFRIFDTPLPHIGSFLILSLGNFDQFLTLPNCQRRLWTPPTLYPRRSHSKSETANVGNGSLPPMRKKTALFVFMWLVFNTKVTTG